MIKNIKQFFILIQYGQFFSDNNLLRFDILYTYILRIINVQLLKNYSMKQDYKISIPLIRTEEAELNSNPTHSAQKTKNLQIEFFNDKSDSIGTPILADSRNPQSLRSQLNIPLQADLQIQSGISSKQRTQQSQPENRYNHLENFNDDQIKEAFNILDMNKDGGITADDLMYFLDFIGEKVTQEEVEEMIRICDTDGSKEVRIEEFKRMALGWSQNIVQERKSYQRIDSEQDFYKRHKDSPQFGMKKSGTTQKSTFSKQTFDAFEIRRRTIIELFEDIQLDQLFLQRITENFQGIKNIEHANYRDFMQIFEFPDSQQSKVLFNSFQTEPVLENQITDDTLTFINVKLLIISLLGQFPIKNNQKFELAYQMMDIQNLGYINYDQFLDLIRHLLIRNDIIVVDEKLQKKNISKLIHQFYQRYGETILLMTNIINYLYLYENN
ncbi:hypothetical protein pb186bvf_000254 [Paramecium bursaria]